MPPPTAFLSYSHDSDDHKAWVLRLATDLRTNGIEARLDRWHLRPGEEAGPFMERSVKDSVKVLVVCSDTYVNKAEGRHGGAGYESALVTAELVRNQGTSKFIPILRNNTVDRVPSFLAGRIHVDFREDRLYEDALTTLLRAISDLPPLDPPPIGELPLTALPVSTETASGPAHHSEPSADAVAPVDELEELLQNPNRRIRLSKMFWSAAKDAREQLDERGLYRYDQQPEAESIASKVTMAEQILGPLVPLLVTAGRWANRDQIPTIANTIAHLLDVPQPKGTFYDANTYIARYPALIALYAAGLGALSEDRLENLKAVLSVGVPASHNDEPDRPLVVALHSGAPFAQSFWKLLPGMERRHTPLSDHLGEFLKPGVLATVPNEAKQTRLFDRLESLIAIAYADATYGDRATGWIPLGTFLWRDPARFQRMDEELAKLGPAWGLLQAGFFGGAVDRAAEIIKGATEYLGRVRTQLGVF